MVSLHEAANQSDWIQALGKLRQKIVLQIGWGPASLEVELAGANLGIKLNFL